MAAAIAAEDTANEDGCSDGGNGSGRDDGGGEVEFQSGEDSGEEEQLSPEEELEKARATGASNRTAFTFESVLSQLQTDEVKATVTRRQSAMAEAAEAEAEALAEAQEEIQKRISPKASASPPNPAPSAAAAGGAESGSGSDDDGGAAEEMAGFW